MRFFLLFFCLILAVILLSPFQDRPLLYGELARARERCLARNPDFDMPLVSLSLHPNQKSSRSHLLAASVQYPAVMKFGSTHAGYGSA